MVGGPGMVAASLGDPGEAFVTFGQIGKAHKEFAGHDFRLIERACIDQIEYDVVVSFKRLPSAELLALESMSEHVGLEPFSFYL